MLKADWIAESFLGTECNRVVGSIKGNKMGDRLDALFLRFQIKGFLPIEIPELIKDVLDIMDNRELSTITAIDQELEELGWGINIMDNATYKLITSLVEGNVS
jgi:hypothetical protein